jgi:ribosomal protein S17E
MRKETIIIQKEFKETGLIFPSKKLINKMHLMDPKNVLNSVGGYIPSPVSLL